MDESSLLFLKQFVKLGHQLGFVPYKLVRIPRAVASSNLDFGSRNSSASAKVSEEWVYDSSKGRKIFLAFTVLLMLTQEGFMIFRTVEAYSNEQVPDKERLQILYVSSILMILNIFQWINLNFYGQHCHLYNAVVQTVQHLDRRTTSGGDKKKSKATSSSHLCWIFRICVFITFFAGIYRVVYVFKHPEFKFHLTSLAQQGHPKDISLILKILAAGFHFQTSICQAFMVFFQTMTYVWYMSAVLPIIKMSRLEFWREGHQLERLEDQSEIERKGNILCHQYHCLTILHRKFERIYGLVPLGFELTVLDVAVMNMFLAVVHKDYGSMVKAIGLTFLCHNVFKQLGEVFEESKMTVESWKKVQSQRREKWLSKFARSCRPIKVNVGGFFYIDRQFVLTLLSIIINQAANLILSFN